MLLYDIPKFKLEEWKWTNPRLLVLIEIIKKNEEPLEKGKNIVYPLNPLMKDFGYTDERYIRHNSFINQIRSDISLLEPFKLNGGRLTFGSFGYEGGNKKVFFNYVRQEILRLTVEADIRNGDKNIVDNEGKIDVI